jgi:hypothetical protein
LSINSDYSGDYDIRTVWDGITTESKAPDENNVIEIESAAQFARLSYASNINGTEYYNDKGPVTIKLMTDIDLDHQTWRPIVANYEISKGFCGVLDGNGHTISNLHVETTSNSGDQYASLFGVLSGATIKNLTIDHATIINNNTGEKIYTGVLAALAGYNSIDNVLVPTTIENVTIKGLIVVRANKGYVGGVVAEGGGDGCILKNVKIEADEGSYINAVNCSYCGGIAGHMFEGPQEGLSSNINLIASNPLKGNTAIGGLIGGADKAASTFKNCSCSGKIELNNYNSNNAFQVDSYEYYDEDIDDFIDMPIYSYPRNMSIGGLLGTILNTSFESDKATFSNCSFTGTITSYFVDSNGDKKDMTPYVKEKNDYWEYMGWVDTGTSGYKDNSSYVKITE